MLYEIAYYFALVSVVASLAAAVIMYCRMMHDHDAMIAAMQELDRTKRIDRIHEGELQREIKRLEQFINHCREVRADEIEQARGEGRMEMQAEIERADRLRMEQRQKIHARCTAAAEENEA